MSLKSDICPTENEIFDIKTCESSFLESLRKFLEVLIKRRLKRSSVGQVIISPARLRSVALPITFGLGVEIDNTFESGWLIDELSKLGFSVSYDKIKCYKQSIISNEDFLKEIATRKPDLFQGPADNVDHNISMLDEIKLFSRYLNVSCIHWQIVQLSYKGPHKKTEIN